MDFLEPAGGHLAKTTRGKPFPKGKSGNPTGKRRGTRNAATLISEALLDGQSEALTNKAIEMALRGDSGLLPVQWTHT